MHAYIHSYMHACMHTYIYIRRFVFIMIDYFNMFSTNHITLMLSSLEMFMHVIFIYNSTALANYRCVGFVRHAI